MNDYFDQFEQSVGAALERGAHRPWYTRVGRIPHGRAFAAVFGALVIGAPAGAVSNCFGACVPVHAKVTVSAGHSPHPPAADAPVLLGLPEASGFSPTRK